MLRNLALFFVAICATSPAQTADPPTGEAKPTSEAKKPANDEKPKPRERTPDELLAEARELLKSVDRAKHESEARVHLQDAILRFEIVLEDLPASSADARDIQRELATTHTTLADHYWDPSFEKHLGELQARWSRERAKEHYEAGVKLYDGIATNIVAQYGRYPATREEHVEFLKTANHPDKLESSQAVLLLAKVESESGDAHADIVSTHSIDSDAWAKSFNAAIAKNEQVEKDYAVLFSSVYAGFNVVKLLRQARKHSDAIKKLHEIEGRIDDVYPEDSRVGLGANLIMHFFSSWKALDEHEKIIERGEAWVLKSKGADERPYEPLVRFELAESHYRVSRLAPSSQQEKIHRDASAAHLKWCEARSFNNSRLRELKKKLASE